MNAALAIPALKLSALTVSVSAPIEGSLTEIHANSRLVRLLNAAPIKRILKMPRCLMRDPPTSAPNIVIMTPNIFETVAISCLENPMSK